MIQIDDQLELSCELHRQIGRFGALQNPVGVARGTLEQNAEIRAVDYEAAHFGIFPKRVDSRELALYQRSRNLSALAEQERVGRDQNSARQRLVQSRQSRLDPTAAVDVEHINGHAQSFRGRPQLLQ